MKSDIMPGAGLVDDVRLVELGLEGNREAFGQLVARYQSPICALAYSTCGNLASSEDLAQETFIIAWRNLGELKEPAKFKSWLFGIARNLIHNTCRQQTRNPLAAAEPLDDSLTADATVSSPTDQAISKEEEGILWRSLERIPQGYREPLILFYREHQSIERVAAVLDLSEDVVRQRLSRGRKLLQEQVLAFVEGALERTNPGQAFTLAVLATLPAMTISAKAVTLGAAVKGGAAAKGAGWIALGGAILAPLLMLFEMWTDYRMKRKARFSPRELKMLKVYYVIIAADVAVFVVLCTVLMSFAPELIRINPMLFASLIVGLILGDCVAIGFIVGCFSRAAKRIEAEQAPAESVAGTRSPVWEYCSRFELLGLPLIHLRFGGWFGGQMDERLKASKLVKAWIVATDACAVGVLFAYGGVAIAPLSIGACAIGLFSFGGIAVGALAVGGFGFGVWALAPFAFGWQAFGRGGVAIAWNVAWGWFAIAHHHALGEFAYGAQANTEFVRQLLNANSFFRFCTTKMTLARMISITWVWMIPVLISLIVQGWTVARRRRARQHQSNH